MSRCPTVYEPPPFWLAPTSNIILFLSVPTSLYTFYLIGVVTPPHTDQQYKMYLLAYHAVSSSASILNCLVAIVHYMPSFLYVQVGLLNLNSFLLLSIDLIIQSVGIILALIVLLYRFSIVLYGDRKKKTFRIIFFCLFFSSCVPAGTSSLYFQTTYNGTSAKERLVKDCPHFKPLADSYELIYMNDPAFVDNIVHRVVLFTIFSFFSFTIGLLFCLREFKERTQFFSKATRRLQTRVLINLACALAIPSLAHGIPAMGAVPVLAFNLQLELWVSTMIWFMDSLHVIMNCIVFVSLNDYYLAQVKKDFKCFVCFKQKVAPPSHIYT